MKGTKNWSNEVTKRANNQINGVKQVSSTSEKTSSDELALINRCFESLRRNEETSSMNNELELWSNDELFANIVFCIPAEVLVRFRRVATEWTTQIS